MASLSALALPLNEPSRAGQFRSSATEALTKGTEAEVQEFLSARPVHTVIMASFIRDNGLVSKLNRGRFYCHRNYEGRIDGVALIGHVTLFETTSDAALEAFARLVRRADDVHMIIGEQPRIALFWQYFTNGDQTPHQVRSELLFEQRLRMLHQPLSAPAVANAPMLRLASRDDLGLVMTTHARMAVEEFGLEDPIAADAHGFRRRCARRIDQGRVWLLIENGSLLFKTDVVSETPEAVYLEGIYVRPDKRGQGYGLRCLSQLSRHLLGRAASICLFVNERNLHAQAFYRSAGFRQLSRYTTILVER